MNHDLEVDRIEVEVISVEVNHDFQTLRLHRHIARFSGFFAIFLK